MITKSTIKYIQCLQQKKHRDEYNQFIAEGPKVVNELLEQNIFNCTVLYCTEDWFNNYAQSITSIDAETIFTIKDFELEKISALSVANQVLAVFDKKILPIEFNYKNKLSIVLDDIQDPGNLGTIIRTADWFGIENIICSNNSADCYAPKVVQSTMASLGRVNIVYTNLQKLLEDNNTIKSYAAVLNGTNINAIKNITEGFLMFGNESKGLSAELIALAQYKITIPKIGAAESLNIAIAAGIIMHQITLK